MSEVKRYRWHEDGIYITDPGDSYAVWVRADDYDALRAENEALKAENAELRARVLVVPDRFALVPVEPTREMFVAVNKEDDKAYAGGCDHGAQFDWLWAAAIDAAPRLNGKTVSESLIRDAQLILACLTSYDYHGTMATAFGEGWREKVEAVRDGLRAVIGEGKGVES